jgi:hypothetical protein
LGRGADVTICLLFAPRSRCDNLSPLGRGANVTMHISPRIGSPAGVMGAAAPQDHIFRGSRGVRSPRGDSNIYSEKRRRHKHFEFLRKPLRPGCHFRKSSKQTDVERDVFLMDRRLLGGGPSPRCPISPPSHLPAFPPGPGHRPFRSHFGSNQLPCPRRQYAPCGWFRRADHV